LAGVSLIIAGVVRGVSDLIAFFSPPPMPTPKFIKKVPSKGSFKDLRDASLDATSTAHEEEIP